MAALTWYIKLETILVVLPVIWNKAHLDVWIENVKICTPRVGEVWKLCQNENLCLEMYKTWYASVVTETKYSFLWFWDLRGLHPESGRAI